MQTMAATPDKTELRRLAQTRRDAACTACDAAPAQRRLLAHVTAIPAIERVSGYAPIRSEIDPMPVLAALHDEGMRVCLPVVQGKGQPLVFRAWTPGCAMVAGAFGAMIPDTDDEVVPELLITPLLAFDGAGMRLGYGGGFYDRTLAHLRAERRTWAIGFAWEAQRMDTLPAEATDQPLDAVVTEAATHYPR